MVINPVWQDEHYPIHPEKYVTLPPFNQKTPWIKKLQFVFEIFIDVWLEEKQKKIADSSQFGHCIEGTGYKNLEATPKGF